MRYHKKSNNGVFSKAQKRSSRSLMSKRRFGRFNWNPKAEALSVGEINKMGMMAKVILALMGRRR